ncbi:urea amidolyase [Hanseniaspora vineae]
MSNWGITEWVEFHKKSTKEQSFQKLAELVKSQKIAPEDPAWISVIDESILSKQLDYLYTLPNYTNLPLFGVPIGVKDNIDFEYLPTTAACPSFLYTPEKDATVVSLLRRAGAIVLGKTNLDQFATGLVGCRSPYGKTPCVFSDKHVSGGSSAGSGSVVGRGIVPIALGTDTAGSGRVPAALNNLIGLKPTKGVFSCSGVVPACKSLDCVSIFAMNLADAEKCFKIMAKFDGAQDEYSRHLPEAPLQKFSANSTIAIPKNCPWYGETENPKLFEHSVSILKQTGANVIEIDFTPFLELARCLYEGAWVAERYAAVQDFYSTNPPEKDLDPVVTGIIKGATKYDATAAFNFEYKRQGIQQEISKILESSKIDLLCVPTCPLNPTFEDLEKEPVKINSYQGTWTNFVNLADMAALAIPSGFRSTDSLPQGITLIGPKFSDYALLDLAKRFFKINYPENSRTSGKFLNQPVGQRDTEITGPELNLDACVQIAVVGAHLKGLPLHWQLEACNAFFVKSIKTASNYKLYALPKVGPVLKPGLKRIVDPKVEGEGNNIDLEVYAIPQEFVGKFISYIPEPLGIGSVELENGEWVKCFICEEFGYAQKGSVDITKLGGFRPYIQQLKAEEAKKTTIPKIVEIPHERESEHSDLPKPFDTVLVANRGEIAVRIMKTLKKLGIKSVAVYSDPDKYAEHATVADVAIPLHGTTAAQTYLDVEKIMAAAKETNSQAIIPGYGFLSENADFSDRCGREGIVFVGPSGEAIRKLGLKHSAREIAEKAGVPLVPGSDLISSAKQAREVAATIGYPIMVKSSAGGGGIGLQKVDDEEDIERVFETVSHQGQAYFGDSSVFLERYVENSRHVEIQMLGDGFGKAKAIGERDCSLQRRNQKIIEETPAPNLPDATRAKMRAASESLGSLLKYKCAGTVEFIYDQKRDEFYFLEVNARLQVEHPITEQVTNLDLVEWMLRLAANNAPSLDTIDITPRGASMEARLYAENPVKDFRPSPGQLTHVNFPEWARIDGWVKKGTKISAEYDPTLAKIIVHGNDRADCLAKLNEALNETSVYGCITNIDYLRSIASSEMFADAKMHTKILDSYNYQPSAIEITSPGAYTTVQDYPGRVAHWRIGVPPSGPMDAYSFRLANRIVGNHYKAPAIEVTLNGPKVLFHTNTVIAITGGTAPCTLNETPIEQNKPVYVRRGDLLSIGKLTTGCRVYLAVRNGVDVPEYLGSRSTFALGNMGGYNGRALKLGDVLFLNQPELESATLPGPAYEPEVLPNGLIPSIPAGKEWTIGVTCGPHGSPDFFKPESVEEFFSEQWKVHYNSNRFGVRLSGPKPIWARQNGGEGGLHPSNQHDYVYSLGAVNFTGDEPVIVTCDGPSLGGFVCQAVVPEGELWKVGQVKPGDMIRFVPVSYDAARSIKESQDAAIESLDENKLVLLTEKLILPTYQDPVLKVIPGTSEFSPKVTFRQAGDRYILVEYGELEMNLNFAYRINRLINKVAEMKTIGIVEMSQGVRSVLIEFDGYKITQSQLLDLLNQYESEIIFDGNWNIKTKAFKLPVAFEDSKTLDCVKRYQETIRSKAPWLPNNVDFIADVNGVTKKDVKDMIYSAKFMVLGLGDVFLGAPCAVPLDPRHRFLGSKYNPSRTFTPNGTVGIGGMYMCIYAMDSPGGYQLVGRTIPIWDKLMLGAHSKEHPWLLTPFDTVEFYLVSEEELNQYTEDCENGVFKVLYEESEFDHKDYLAWIEENKESIEAFKKTQDGEKAEEFARLIAVANQELEENAADKPEVQEEYPENAEMVYSEYSGRFWKAVVAEGDDIQKGDGLIVIEAMKTEMAVAAPATGKVFKILHKNGDMVEAGDLVAVIV